MTDVERPPPGLVVRAEGPSDRRDIGSVVAEAFGSPDEARLVDAIRDSSTFVPEWSLVAVLDARVCGHVLVSYVELVDAGRRHRVPTLSPLAVDPALQRRGIGGTLVRAVTRRVDDAGEPLVVLEGSPWYYDRFGFEYAVPLGISISLPEWAPAEAAQVLRLRKYDASIRGHVEYPAAFGEVTDH